MFFAPQKANKNATVANSHNWAKGNSDGSALLQVQARVHDEQVALCGLLCSCLVFRLYRSSMWEVRGTLLLRQPGLGYVRISGVLERKQPVQLAVSSLFTAPHNEKVYHMWPGLR